MNYGKNTEKKRPHNWADHHKCKKAAFENQVKGLALNLFADSHSRLDDSSSSSDDSSSSSNESSSSNSDDSTQTKGEGPKEPTEVEAVLDSYFKFNVGVSPSDALRCTTNEYSIYEKNMNKLKGAQPAIEKARLEIQRAYEAGLGRGLGKNLNHYISDISIVMSYCESHVTRADMLVSINPDEDETSKFWYQYFHNEESQQPKYVGKKRKDNVTGGISKVLAFLLVVEEDDFATFVPPCGSIKNLAQDFKLIDAYVDYRWKLNHRAVSILGDLSKLNFFIKRLAAAFYCIQKEQRTKLIKRYNYITEVLNATPALAEYISMRMKTVRASCVLQHNEKYSVDGMKEAKLWVSREKIKADRRSIFQKIILFQNLLQNKTYPLEGDDEQNKKDRRMFGALQCMIISLICNTCYGNRTQVMQHLRVSERIVTCNLHKNCKMHSEEHIQQRVEWDLNKVGREKRSRDRKGVGLVEPDCVTKCLNWFIIATNDFRTKCKDPSFVFFPLVFHYGEIQYISFRKSSNFQNTDVNKSIRYTNSVLNVTIPKPSVMRHLYCTHEYLDWHESAPGEDSRSFEKLLEDISYDMNTTVHQILNTYLVCQYSRYQLHNFEARNRAARKVNKTLTQYL